MLRIGLIGCGAVSRKHVTAINNTPDLELAVCCDQLAEGVEGVPFETDACALHAYDLDLTVICTPPATHRRLAFDAMQYGSDVLIEKPIALTWHDAIYINEAARIYKRNAWEVKQYRHSPWIRQAWDAVQAGALGKLHQIITRMQWCRFPDYFTGWRGQPDLDGGVFASQGCHLVDLMHYFGGHVKHVQAKFWNVMDLPCEDSGMAFLEYASGARGVMELTIAARPYNIEASISLLGDEGTIVIGGQKLDKVVTWACDFPCMEPAENCDLHELCYRHYAMGDRNLLVDSKDAMDAVKLINRIYEAANS